MTEVFSRHPDTEALAPRIDDLVGMVAEHDAQPVDRLHVTAILESMAINDSHAAELVEGDTFDLAGLVFRTLRQRTPASTDGHRRIPRTPSAVLDLLRGPLSLIPVMVVLAALGAWQRFGGWGGEQALACTLGVAASLMITHPFGQAMSRRGAIYLGRCKHRAARQFLALTSAIAGATLLVAAAVAVGAGAVLRIGTGPDRVIFAASLVALGTVWLVSSMLGLVHRLHWLGIGLVTGGAVGAAVLAITSAVGGVRVGLATWTGLTVAVAVMLAALRHGLRSDGSRSSGSPMVISLPYALSEAVPYFVYGVLYMAFILIPHVLGWVGHIDGGASHTAARGQIESGLGLSLLPLLLAGGVSERTARLFWPFAAMAQRETAANEPREFGAALERFHRTKLRGYLRVLGALSLAAGLCFEWFSHTGQLERWLAMPDMGHARIVFWGALGAYFLLGWAGFNCLFGVSVGRPALATRGFLIAAVVTLVIGIPLCIAVNYEFAGIAFFIGAAMLVVSTQRGVRTLTESAAYFYSSSF